MCGHFYTRGAGAMAAPRPVATNHHDRFAFVLAKPQYVFRKFEIDIPQECFKRLHVPRQKWSVYKTLSTAPLNVPPIRSNPSVASSIHAACCHRYQEQTGSHRTSLPDPCALCVCRAVRSVYPDERPQRFVQHCPRFSNRRRARKRFDYPKRLREALCQTPSPNPQTTYFPMLSL